MPGGGATQPSRSPRSISSCGMPSQTATANASGGAPLAVLSAMVMGV
jgi:hypothetical protein